MKKEYIYGGLAVIAILGFLVYTRKQKSYSNGFFNASGTQRKMGSPACYSIIDGSFQGYKENYKPCPKGTLPFRAEDLNL